MPRRPKRTPGTPRVEPPLRNANAAVRAATALDLAIAGHDWQSIANGAGYASRGAAFTAVQRELNRVLSAKVETLRMLSLARLGRYRLVYVPKALAGDGWSLDRCLRIDEREAQLMGLDTPKVDVLANQNVRRVYERRAS